MGTRIIRLDRRESVSTALAEAVRVIETGGIVVGPTETRYGMLVRADRQEAIEHMYDVKQRDIKRPTALLVQDRAGLDRHGRMNPAAERLASTFLPGPLTLVLEAIDSWPPPRVIDGKIGLRWSSNEFVGQLMAELPFELTATSANRSNESDFDTVAEIANEFGESVDLYLDGGPLTGPTSTVVDCSRGKPVVLREGAISEGEIRKALN